VNITLLPARPEHYEWLIAGTTLSGPNGIWLAEPELEPPDILVLLRDAAVDVDAVLGTSSWLVLDGKEVVGSCDIKRKPDEKGDVEIGYGIAAYRQGRGVGSRAIALLLNVISKMPQIKGITAETTTTNYASQKVLKRNGFVRVGNRHDDEDGDLFVWRWKSANKAA